MVVASHGSHPQPWPEPPVTAWAVGAALLVGAAVGAAIDCVDDEVDADGATAVVLLVDVDVVAVVLAPAA
jgi:hypothetical protein